MGKKNMQSAYIVWRGKASGGICGEQTENRMAYNGSYYDTEMPRVFETLIFDEYLEESIRMMDRFLHYLMVN